MKFLQGLRNEELINSDPMVPNRTCHGDQPCDKDDQGDLQFILGPRTGKLSLRGIKSMPPICTIDKSLVRIPCSCLVAEFKVACQDHYIHIV